MVTINTKPRFIRKIGIAKTRMIAKHRVAQQRRFLVEKKKIQLQQFRTQQKFELFSKRRRIRQQQQIMRRAGQQRLAGRIRKTRKTLRTFGIKW